MTSRFLLAKHILIIEPEPGRLDELAPRLKELGFVVLRATTPAAAREVVTRTGLLSLVAIDDAVGKDAGSAILEDIKSEHPDLPVIWISSREATAPLSRSQFTPDALLYHPVDVETLHADVDRLLMQQLYPPDVVELLADACAEVMRGAFGTELELKETHIRANRNALGTINAILPFCGRHIAGRVVVGAEPSLLLAIRDSALPGSSPMEDAAEDLAGEYANLVAGRMKAHFAEHDLDFELGTPIILVGTDIGVRYRASRPALVLVLETRDARLSVAFCFDTFDPARILAARDEAAVTTASGELQFL
jgi:CheY-specific phosphatase CheX